MYPSFLRILQHRGENGLQSIDPSVASPEFVYSMACLQCISFGYPVNEHMCPQELVHLSEAEDQCWVVLKSPAIGSDPVLRDFQRPPNMFPGAWSLAATASLLYGLAGKLLGELCSPVLQDYVAKPWGYGAKDEFEKLKDTLSAIADVLLDAEEKQRTNHQVRDWLVKIKLVFYDVEDLLQEISYEALKRQVMTKNKRAKEVRIFFSSSNQVKYRLKMGRKVKLIREKLGAIALDSNAFSLTQRHEEMHIVRINRREETHSFVPRENVIGRDEDIQSLKKLLLESDGEINVSVASIVGIGGLGKTTLAQSVYNLEKVKKHFELMMWVCVSESFDVKILPEIQPLATGDSCG